MNIFSTLGLHLSQMNSIFQFINQEIEAAFIQRKVCIQLKDLFLSKFKFPNKLIEVKTRNHKYLFRLNCSVFCFFFSSLKYEIRQWIEWSKTRNHKWLLRFNCSRLSLFDVDRKIVHQGANSLDLENQNFSWFSIFSLNKLNVSKMYKINYSIDFFQTKVYKIQNEKEEIIFNVNTIYLEILYLFENEFIWKIAFR
jgi:hypothetical protein